LALNLLSLKEQTKKGGKFAMHSEKETHYSAATFSISQKKHITRNSSFTAN